MKASFWLEASLQPFETNLFSLTNKVVLSCLKLPVCQTDCEDGDISMTAEVFEQHLLHLTWLTLSDGFRLRCVHVWWALLIHTVPKSQSKHRQECKVFLFVLKTSWELLIQISRFAQLTMTIKELNWIEITFFLPNVLSSHAYKHNTTHEHGPGDSLKRLWCKHSGGNRKLCIR